MTRRSSTSIARDSYRLATAAPEVIARRLSQFGLAGLNPSPRDQAEFYLMTAEKVAAFQESWVAMGLELFQANVRIASSLWWPWSMAAFGRSGPGAAEARRVATAVLGAGLAPVRRRAVANARRLRTASRKRR